MENSIKQLADKVNGITDKAIEQVREAVELAEKWRAECDKMENVAKKAVENTRKALEMLDGVECVADEVSALRRENESLRNALNTLNFRANNFCTRKHARDPWGREESRKERR